MHLTIYIDIFDGENVRCLQTLPKQQWCCTSQEHNKPVKQAGTKQNITLFVNQSVTGN